jgi:hypothetical protein
MINVKPNLQERLKLIIEDACVGCGGGGMSVGDGGFTGDADPEGPVAGYDPVMTKVKRRKKKRNGVNEGKKPLPDFKMMLKASDLDQKAENTKDKSDKMKLIDRARKIRAEMQ